MREDFAVDENNDIKIVNGDFVIEQSDQQHINDIFLAHKGEYKEQPLIGFGASKYLKTSTSNINDFLRNLKVQLEFDGYPDADIDISEGVDKIRISV